MKTETKVTHTPTPWKVGPFQDQVTIIDPREGDFIATMHTAYVSDDEQVANAEFIVRAVNSHEELLGALKEARMRLIAMGNNKTALAWRIDDAIAQAEAQP